jgi:hypothetical protein
MLRDLTRRCLERLEALIDERHVARARELQRRAFAFEAVDHIPTVIRYPVPEDKWPNPNFQQFFDDPEWMLLSELKFAYQAARLGDDGLYGIRANYGTGIVSSLFGCPIHTFDDVLPVATQIDDLDTVRRLAQAGARYPHAGLAGRALETVAFFREVLRDYPVLNRTVPSQMLDTQGTFDNASIIWGSRIFYAMYDEPEMVGALIQTVTDTIAALVREHRRIDGCPMAEHGGAWENLGGICLRNDSCINLSHEMYERYVKPYDAQLLGRFGGWIHFCGRAHQWWPSLLDLPGLKGVNPYQGEFYDLGAMYARCAAARVAIAQWTTPVAAREREMIRTGFSRSMSAPSLVEAQRLLERAHTTGWADEG